MLKVFITIDTEVGYVGGKWNENKVSQKIERDIFGITPQGEYGIQYMIDDFKKFKIKANFFVESLFSFICGNKLFGKILDPILNSENDLQLHIHPEWLRLMDNSIIQNPSGFFLKDFTKEQQFIIIKQGLENLRKFGVKDINTFRAGDFAINFDTLSALSGNKIEYDTSYNSCYLNSTRDIKLQQVLLQPKKLNGVCEFPINFFYDVPGHCRSMQLAAISFNELKHILTQAWENHWYSIVIVMHSFELINRNKKSDNPPNVDYILLKRFEEFCSFLADNRDKFNTSVFSELDSTDIREVENLKPLQSNICKTAVRYYQQMKRRYYKFKNL